LRSIKPYAFVIIYIIGATATSTIRPTLPPPRQPRRPTATTTAIATSTTTTQWADDDETLCHAVDQVERAIVTAAATSQAEILKTVATQTDPTPDSTTQAATNYTQGGLYLIKHAYILKIKYYVAIIV